jgi:hypothetical protein
MTPHDWRKQEREQKSLCKILAQGETRATGNRKQMHERRSTGESMTLDINDPAVQTHLSLLQGVINRMAGNSATCKTLCATLVSTVGAISYAGDSPGGMWIAVIPILLFFYLDAMYLSLEKGFRDTYNAFVLALHTGEVAQGELFKIKPPADYKCCTKQVGAALSWATAPVYVALLLLTFIIMNSIGGGTPIP